MTQRWGVARAARALIVSAAWSNPPGCTAAAHVQPPTSATTATVALMTAVRGRPVGSDMRSTLGRRPRLAGMPSRSDRSVAPAAPVAPVAPAASPFGAPFAGVLLDMDGTLIDSIAAVERSWIRWCEEFGVDPLRLRGFHGVPAANVIAQLLPEERRDEAFDRILAIEVDDVEGIVVLPGAAGLLGTLSDGAVPTAIVTSGTRDLAEARIAATRLPHPPVVVTASDVTRGKPWPDPWLEGARRLGVDPGECVVVEDAVAGLRAARAAGCGALVGVLGSTPREELEAVADLVVPDVGHLVVTVERGRARLAGA